MGTARPTYGTGAKRVVTAEKQAPAGMQSVMAAHAKAGTFKGSKKSKGR